MNFILQLVRIIFLWASSQILWILISQEIDSIYRGHLDRENNPLKRAPHTLAAVTAEDWDRPYSRNQAAFPLPEQVGNKFWPAVARINNVHGDRNLVCTCSSLDEFVDE